MMNSQQQTPQPTRSTPLHPSTSTRRSTTPMLPTPSSSRSSTMSLEQLLQMKLDFEEQLGEKRQQCQDCESGIQKNVLTRQINQLRDKLGELEQQIQLQVQDKQDDGLPHATLDKIRHLERDLATYRGQQRKDKLFPQRGLDILPSPSTSTLMPNAVPSSLLPLPPPPSGSTPTKRRSKVPNNDRRNTDIEFATEIGQGLLIEVRKMQAILQEKEEQLRALEIQKADLERSAEAMAKQLRQREENEEKLKEETWNLELTKQELTLSVTELQQHLHKATSEQTKLAKQTNELRSDIEQLRDREQKLTTLLETSKQRHEQDMASLRRHCAGLQREAQQHTKHIDTLTSELAIAKAQSRLGKHQSSTPGSGNPTGQVSSDDSDPSDPTMVQDPATHPQYRSGGSSSSSPPSSPKQLPVSGGGRAVQAMEVETLKTSLAHAHRMVSNLRSHLHKEKTEKFEFKKLLAESQETIEQLQNDPQLWVDAPRSQGGGTPDDPKKRKVKQHRRATRKLHRTGGGISNGMGGGSSTPPLASSRSGTKRQGGDDGDSLGDDDDDDDDAYSYSSVSDDNDDAIDDTNTPTPAGFTSLSLELSQSNAKLDNTSLEMGVMTDDILIIHDRHHYEQQLEKLHQLEQWYEASMDKSKQWTVVTQQPCMDQAPVALYETTTQTNDAVSSAPVPVHQDCQCDLIEPRDEVAEALAISKAKQEATEEAEVKSTTAVNEAKAAAAIALSTAVAAATAKALEQARVESSKASTEAEAKTAKAVAEAIARTKEQADVESAKIVTEANTKAAAALTAAVNAARTEAEANATVAIETAVAEATAKAKEQADENSAKAAAALTAAVDAAKVEAEANAAVAIETAVAKATANAKEQADMDSAKAAAALRAAVDSARTEAEAKAAAAIETAVAETTAKATEQADADSAKAAATLAAAVEATKLESDLKAAAAMAAAVAQAKNDADIQSRQAAIDAEAKATEAMNKAVEAAKMQVEANSAVALAAAVAEATAKAKQEAADEAKSATEAAVAAATSDMEAKSVAALSAAVAAAITRTKEELSAEPTIISTVDQGTQSDKIPVNDGVEAATQMDPISSMDTGVQHEYIMIDSGVQHESTLVDAYVQHEYTTVDTAVQHEYKPVDVSVQHECTSVDATVQHEFTSIDTAVQHEYSAVDQNTQYDVVIETMDSATQHEPTVTNKDVSTQYEDMEVKSAIIPTVVDTGSDPIPVNVGCDMAIQVDIPMVELPVSGLQGEWITTSQSTKDAHGAQENVNSTTKSADTSSNGDNTWLGTLNDSGHNVLDRSIGVVSDTNSKLPSQNEVDSTASKAEGSIKAQSNDQKMEQSSTSMDKSRISRDDHDKALPARPTQRPPSSLLDKATRSSNGVAPAADYLDDRSTSSGLTRPASLSISSMGAENNQATQHSSNTMHHGPSSSASSAAMTAPSITSSIHDEHSTMVRALPKTTDPTISSITQTMIGDWLVKYTRKPVGQGFSERRHERYFWIHPYTRTLYWCTRAPGADGGELKAKSAFVENVMVGRPDSNSPEGSGVPCLLIQTATRQLKIKAPTKERHDLWFESLNYLLTRTGQSTLETTPSILPRRSISASILRKPSIQRLNDTAYRTTSTTSHAQENQQHLHHHALQYDDDDEALENVRLCCDGKHDVGRLVKDHSHRPAYHQRKQQLEHTHH